MLVFFTDRLHITLLQHDDLTALEEFEKQNRNFFGNVSPLQTHQFPIKDLLRDQSEGRSFRFILRFKDHSQIIGTCNFTQIFRGPFQACYVGYKIAEEHQGKGLMREALARTIQHMFDEENIHRVMANYIPSNVRSEKLLLGLGFQKEGYAKDYLLVNGKWEDHVMTALINSNWKQSS